MVKWLPSAAVFLLMLMGLWGAVGGTGMILYLAGLQGGTQAEHALGSTAGPVEHSRLFAAAAD